jgi:hypothetical protein
MERVLLRGDDENTMQHEWFELGENNQGTGVGARMLVDSLDVYMRHRIDHVTTTANIDVGGNAWAKLGFKAEDPAAFRDMVMNRIYPISSISDTRKEEIIREVRGRETFAPEWLANQPEGKSILLGANWHARINLGISGNNLRVKLRDKIAKKRAVK